MAESSNYRSYRPNDALARSTTPQPAASDPLAELARLIGQHDPFADFGTEAPRKPATPSYGMEPQAGDWRGTAAPATPGSYAMPPGEPSQPPLYAQPEAPYQAPAQETYPGAHDPRWDDPRYAAPAAPGRQDWDRSGDPQRSYPPASYAQPYEAQPYADPASPAGYPADPHGYDASRHDPAGATAYPPAGATHDPQAYDQRAYDQRAYDPQAYDPQAYDQQAYDPRGYDPKAYEPQAYDPRAYDPQPHDPRAYDPNAYQHAAPDPAAADPKALDPDSYDPRAYDPKAFGRLAGDPPAPAYAPDPFYRTEPNAAPADDFYDEAPARPRSSKRGLILAVVALAVIGTGSAFAYRTYFGNRTTSGTPPVIKADNAPTKVVPATPTTETASTKTIYDRIDGERVVTRQEKPIDIKDATANATTAPRVIFPGPTPNANTSPANVEPKRVKTLPIRPDGSPVVATTPPPADARISNLVDPAEQAAPPPAAPAAAPVRPTSRRTPPPSQTNTRTAAAEPADAPLSLAPNAAPAAAPRAAAPAPVRTATTGGYAVQVSSQRSEAEAKSSFRTLQSRYANILGGQSPIIRRADLGDRGVYYRAMVGPFSTQEEATQLCSQLKAAGGQCVVQHN